MIRIEKKCNQVGDVLSLVKTRLSGMRKTNTVVLAEDESLAEMARLLRRVGSELQYYASVLELMQAAKNAADTPYAVLILRGMEAEVKLRAMMQAPGDSSQSQVPEPVLFAQVRQHDSLGQLVTPGDPDYIAPRSFQHVFSGESLPSS